MVSYLPEHFRSDLPPEPYFWNIDSVSVGDEVGLNGWALPFFGEPENVKLTLNGVPPKTFHLQAEPGVSKEYPWWPNSEVTRFWAVTDAESLGDAWLHDKEICVEVAPRDGDAKDVATYDSARVMHFKQSLPASPPSEALLRTIGGGSLHTYQLGGRTLFHRFQDVLKQETGKVFRDVGRVLDWGCGPGRIAYHVIPEMRDAQDFLGVDIVLGSVDFSNAAIAPRFKVCETTPPLPVDAASLDVVYAYSVLTHIPGPMLRGWMQEIARVLRPGGVAMMTTLGELAFSHFRTYQGEGAYRAWQAKGVSDEVANDQLDDTNVPSGYYRNTWITAPHLKKLSEGLFEVRRHVSNFYFYQDLFVLRRM